MTDTVIRVEGLSKRYRLGQREPYKTLRDTLARGFVAPYRRLRSMLRTNGQHGNRDKNTLWALKDVSFEVKQGEVMGIIGRNGSGKSTLLKILSKITEPTEGYAEMRGRVGSLLEVGTGFHPELTGRENIYLNGAILGMKRAEIDRKFDEIVSFAEIERFLDTPVKHYSSGMYVRLAFAVAAHLEPEILLVDEVLAVGDIEFQNRCLRRMETVSREGRTVLFVSHNVSAISRLCQQGILLQEGQAVYIGTAVGAIDRYLGDRNSDVNGKLEWFPREKSYILSDLLRIRSYRVVDDDGLVAVNNLFTSKRYWAQIEIDLLQPNADIKVGFAIYSQDQVLLLTSSANDNGRINFGDTEAGRYILTAPIPVHLLCNGPYEIELLCVVERLGWVLPPRGNESRRRFVLFRDVDPNPFSAHRFGGLTSPLAPVLDWTFCKV